MKVLLVHPPIRITEPPHHIPFGIGIIAAVTESLGHSVAVLDVNAFRFGLDVLRVEVKRDEFDVVGISALSSQYKHVKNYLPILREAQPNALIVGGGGCFSTMPEEMLRWNRDFLDVICIGEAENTWVELLDHVYDKRFSKIRGIAYLENDKAKLTKPRPLIGMKDSGLYESLDDLPYPAYDLLPMEVYLANSRIPLCPETMRADLKRLSFIHERGCPFQCRFCTHLGMSANDLSRIYCKKIKGPSIRFFTPEYVVQHVKYARLKWGINFASMLDENMLANKKRCLEIADLWEAEGLAGLVDFGCLGHPATADSEVILRLRDVGLKYVSFGAESANQNILDNLNKKSSPDDIQKAIDTCQRWEVYPITTWMICMPEETVETALNTIRFWKRNQIACKPFFETAYPGTELFNKYRDKIIDEYLTDEEKKAVELAEKHPTKLSKANAEKAKDSALERFVITLGDAVDLVHNLSPIFNDAELYGLQQLMYLKDERRLEKLRKSKELP